MKKQLFFVGIFFLSISVFVFRQWVFGNRVPIAADLQVNFYEPWKSEHSISNFKPLGFDDIRIFYPQKVFATEEIKAGRLPVWNPYEFSGNVHLANSQTATFYPLTLLYAFFPSIFVWSLSSFLLPILAGVFTFLFLKLRVSFLASLFGACVFAFCGAMVVRFEDGVTPGHSIVYLPLALYGLEKYCKEKAKMGLLVALFSLVLAIFAGWFQFSFYVLIVAMLYGIWRKLSVKILLAIFIAVILFTTVHWVPSLLALQYSPRGDASTLDLTKHLMDPFHLITLMSPDFFGHPVTGNYFSKSEYKEGMLFVGLVPLLFVFLPLWRKVVGEKFFLILTFGTMLFGLNLPGLSYLLERIPLISSFLPNRIFILSSFGLSVLSAFGWEYYFKNERKATRILKIVLRFFLIVLSLIVFGIVMIYLNEKVLFNLSHYSFFQRGIERYLLIILQAIRESFLWLLLIAVAIYLISKKIVSSKIFFYVMLIILMCGQIIFADRYLYFSKIENLFPMHPVIEFLQKNTKDDYSRFVTLGDARFTSNTATYYKLFDVEGVDALYPSWYGKFMNFVKTNGKSLSVQDRISVWFSPEIKSINDWKSPFVLNFLRLTGVKYIVIKNNFISPPSELFTPVFNYKQWSVYQFSRPLPKAVFVPYARQIINERDLLQRMFDPNFDPETELLVFEKISPFGKSKGVVEVINYLPNYIELESNSSGPGFVLINDNYFPNWHAFVNGIETNVLKADYTFRAIQVSEGKNKIVLRYSLL